MKKNCILLLFSCLSLFTRAQYDRQNIELVGHWLDSAVIMESTMGSRYNSCWGWVNPKTNVEYAILGSGAGTNIIDLSNPVNPKRVAFIKGKRDKCVWREYKTYKNYLYAISDDAPPNSFQIIDLSYLPDSVHIIHDGTDIFENGHTIYIDGDKMYIAGTRQSSSPNKVCPMALYSLANPEKPLLLRSINQDFNIVLVHDMLAVNDTIYTSTGNGGFYIFFYDSVANKFTQINSMVSYPNQGFNHSSAITSDRKTLIFCDEVPRNLSVKVIDIGDVKNLSIATTFKSNDGATAHNPYIKDNTHAVIAYYQDGLQIFDIRDPKHPYRSGYFDTDTIDGIKNNYNPKGQPYHGNWGAYIDLPSGLILASDMQNGLYVLDPTAALGIVDHKNNRSLQLTAFPNPAIEEVSVKYNLTDGGFITYEVFDSMGKRIFSKTKNEPAGSIKEIIPLTNFSNGIYSVKISGKNIYGSIKFLKE